MVDLSGRRFSLVHGSIADLSKSQQPGSYREKLMTKGSVVMRYNAMYSIESTDFRRIFSPLSSG